MQKFCNILLPILVLSNMVYFYLFPFNNNPHELWVYGGEDYHIQGLRLQTEGGGLDTTFTNEKDFAAFLEQHSADTYKKALEWEIDRAMAEYTSVLVMNDGMVYANYCYPYDDSNCSEIELNCMECDEYGSCLYFNEE